ncbi:MAG: tetratricopeptide repeat protein [Planctomycetia bacterium]
MARRMKRILKSIAATAAAAALVGCQAPNVTGHSVFGGSTKVSAAKPVGGLPAKETAEVRLTMARGLEAEGLYAEAAAQYLGVREAEPDRKVAARLAVIYDRLGETALAETEFTRAKIEQPDDVDVLSDFGVFELRRGRLDEAERCFTDVVRRKPNHDRGWINLGVTRARAGRSTDSLQAFQKVLTPAEAHCNVAAVAASQDKLAEAVASYRAALALNPESTVARMGLDALAAAIETPPAAAPSAIKIPVAVAALPSKTDFEPPTTYSMPPVAVQQAAPAPSLKIPTSTVASPTRPAPLADVPTRPAPLADVPLLSAPVAAVPSLPEPVAPVVTAKQAALAVATTPASIRPSRAVPERKRVELPPPLQKAAEPEWTPLVEAAPAAGTVTAAKAPPAGARSKVAARSSANVLVDEETWRPAAKPSAFAPLAN